MSFFDAIKAWFTRKPIETEGPPAKALEREPPLESKPPEPRATETDPPAPPKRARRAKGETARSDAEIDADARALYTARLAQEAFTQLATRCTWLARHEADSLLPCRCRACLQPATRAAESDGARYLLDFVVTRCHVFFYWMPAELAADAKRLRASMRAAVREELRATATGGRVAREAINPFTKQPMVILEKRERRKLVNPFTGKVVR